MNRLSENCLRFIFSIDSTLRMIYSVDCVVQVIELKDEGENFYNLTVSDGINFKGQFLINRKKKFKLYDIIRIGNIMRSSPKDSRNVIFIFSSSLISTNEKNIIGNPIEFPQENNLNWLKNLDNNNLIKIDGKKEEKKLQIKVQRITLKRPNQSNESYIKKENNPSESLIDSKLLKENVSLENSKLISSESLIKNVKNEKIDPEILLKSSSKKKSNPNINIVNDINSSDRKNSYRDCSQVIQLDKSDIEKIIEINQIDQSSELKLTQEIILSQNIKNTQEIRYTQVFDQNEIIKHIEEINQIEENKNINSKELEKINIPHTNDVGNSNNQLDTYSNFLDEISPTVLLTQIQDEFLIFQNVDTKSANKSSKQFTNNSNDNSPTTIKLARNQSEGHFRMSIPERHVMRSLPSKSQHQLLNEIQDKTNFTIRIRVIKTYPILNGWNIKIIDEKENYGVLTVPNVYISIYRNILKIYDLFEITNGKSFKQKFHNEGKYFFVPITITKDTEISKLNNNITNIKLLEEEYTMIKDIQNLRSNNFSVLGFITNIEQKNFFIDKNGKEGNEFNFFITDFSLSKIKLTIYNDAQKLEIKEGDIIFVSNPIVNRKMLEQYLVINTNSVIFINPNCPTALKLRKNFESASIEGNRNIVNNPSNQIIIGKFKLFELEEYVNSTNFNPNGLFIIKASIKSFNPKLINLISACPLCFNKLKICISDGLNCQKCNTNINEKSAKIFIKYFIEVQDCTSKCMLNFYFPTSSKLLNYVCKKIKIKEISIEEFKKFTNSYNKEEYVEEFELMMSFLKKSEFFFKINVNKVNKNENFSSKSKNKNFYFNVRDFWPVEKKKERETTLRNLKKILLIK